MLRLANRGRRDPLGDAGRGARAMFRDVGRGLGHPAGRPVAGWEGAGWLRRAWGRALDPTVSLLSASQPLGSCPGNGGVGPEERPAWRPPA